MDDLNGAGVRRFVYLVEDFRWGVALGRVPPDPMFLYDLAPIVYGVLLKEIRTNSPARFTADAFFTGDRHSGYCHCAPLIVGLSTHMPAFKKGYFFFSTSSAHESAADTLGNPIVLVSRIMA